MIKDNTQKTTVPLNVRVNLPVVDFNRYYTEMESTVGYETVGFDIDVTALILIDVWERHHNNGWLVRAEENIRSRVIPLVELVRSKGMTIVHIPHEYKMYGIHPDVRPPGEGFPMVLRSITCPKGQDTTDIFAESNEIAVREYDIDVLVSCLRKRGITTLLYAGYASNWCVLHRDAGIISMKRRGFNIVFVRDCSLAIEMPETLEGEYTHSVVTKMIECQHGPSTTLADLKKALGS